MKQPATVSTMIVMARSMKPSPAMKATSGRLWTAPKISLLAMNAVPVSVKVVVQCNADGDGLECSTSERAVPEVCDGLDNDCDGIVDNGIEAPLAAEQRGICAGLTQVCDETGGWVEPDYTSLPNYEEIELTCDGLDNDCDGEIDEGLSAPDADLTLGVCLGATKVCDGEAGWVEPDYGTYSDDYQIEEMWCDNLDNDCDGETDELFLEGGLISYTDLSGATGLGKAMHAALARAAAV